MRRIPGIKIVDPRTGDDIEPTVLGYAGITTPASRIASAVAEANEKLLEALRDGHWIPIGPVTSDCGPFTFGDHEVDEVIDNHWKISVTQYVAPRFGEQIGDTVTLDMFDVSATMAQIRALHTKAREQMIECAYLMTRATRDSLSAAIQDWYTTYSYAHPSLTDTLLGYPVVIDKTLPHGHITCRRVNPQPRIEMEYPRG